MKRRMATRAVILATGLIGLSGAAMAADVKVTIEGIQPGPGEILVALQTEDDFLTNKGSYTVMVPADAERLTAVIEGVMEGTYAVAVVHDENGDGVFAIGEYGPTEAWAVSGMPVAEPSFENSAIEVVDGEENAVTLTMAYTM